MWRVVQTAASMAGYLAVAKVDLLVAAKGVQKAETLADRSVAAKVARLAVLKVVNLVELTVGTRAERRADRMAGN